MDEALRTKWPSLSKWVAPDDLQRSLPPQPFREPVRRTRGAAACEGRSLNFEHVELSKLQLFQSLKIQQQGGFSAHRQFIPADLPDKGEGFAVVDLSALQQVQPEK